MNVVYDPVKPDGSLEEIRDQNDKLVEVNVYTNGNPDLFPQNENFVSDSVYKAHKAHKAALRTLESIGREVREEGIMASSLTLRPVNEDFNTPMDSQFSEEEFEAFLEQLTYSQK
jgi:hypothetical protein